MAAESPAAGGGALPDGLVGPVLVLADAEAVGRLAQTWAEAFAAAGLRHRVRLVRGDLGSREVAAIVAELRRLGAGSCASAGDAAAVATAQTVAAAAGVPCVGLDRPTTGAPRPMG